MINFLRFHLYSSERFIAEGDTEKIQAPKMVSTGDNGISTLPNSNTDSTCTSLIDIGDRKSTRKNPLLQIGSITERRSGISHIQGQRPNIQYIYTVYPITVLL